MVICHYDRTGKRWLFNINCTRGQAYIFACFLRVLRNTRPRGSNRYRVNRRTTDTEAANNRFCANLEKEILNALYRLHPATEEDYAHNELFIL